MSESYLARMRDSPPAAHPDLLISVTETRLPQELAEVPVISLAGLTETQAVDRLIDRLKGRRPAGPGSGDRGSALSGRRPRLRS